MTNSSTGLSDNTASFLAYLLGWISGLVLLFVETRSDVVRLHAAQSVVIFGALTLLHLALPTVPVLGPLIAALLGPVSAVLWLALIVTALLGKAPLIELLGPLVRKVEQGLRPRG